ncbi:MAG: NAD(P)-dependent oxidoreductase [Dehalococcoidia bacterium]|nr:NAD(P)-dependent oxidoreductase [Dehalococcoidia bacterium]
MKRVLVTGAAGCAGCQVVDQLLQGGFHVVAADRPGAPLPDPISGSLEVHHADITDSATAFNLARDVDAVVNLAAIVDIGMPFEKLAPVNLDSVRILYSSARAGGASLFIHFSTGSLYRSAAHPLRENDPLLASNDYARTKLLSEDFVLSRDSTGPAVNVIRPALIFGPRGKVLISALAGFAALLRHYTRRGIRLRGGPRTNLVYSVDIARAIRFLIENPQAHRQVFNIANDDSRPAGEQISDMLEIAGMDLTRRSLRLPISLGTYLRPVADRDLMFKAMNGVLRMLWKNMCRSEGLHANDLGPHVDRESLAYMMGDFVFDNSRLRDLGFQYLYPDLKSGWRETVAWYRDNRWLPAAGPQTAGEK